MSQKPSFRQLEYLVALSQERHFRRAAEKLNVTQPTLSAQIKELERRLQSALVERGAGPVLLTPLGLEIAERAKLILTSVDDLHEMALSSTNGFHGTLRVGVPPTLGAYLLPYVVPKLHVQYPQLKLYVREAKPAGLIDGVLGGDHDLALLPMPVGHSDLMALPLFQEPLRLVCAPDHPLVKKTRVTKADLAGEKVLAMESGHKLHDQVVRLCEEFGAELLRDYEGTSLDTLRLMVGMGVGIAFLPALYIRSEIGQRQELSILNFESAQLQRKIALVWRASSVQQSFFSEIEHLIRSVISSELSELTTID